MAAVDVGTRPDTIGTGQYDDAVEDFWRDLQIPGPQEAANDQPTLDSASRDIDEEIKITKKRKPIAKLDADRLLSERGVPELRRRARKRVKFSGKGHEYDDMNTILQMYQMWLDDLFPKAKFRDGLAMIEKVGHTKRLNVMRKAWITATRPVHVEEPEALDPDFEHHADPAQQDTTFDDIRNDPLHNESTQDQAQPEDDELDQLLAQEQTPKASAVPKSGVRQPFDDDSDQDELDALLDRETNSGDHGPTPGVGNAARNDGASFDDEEEAMREMGM